MMDQQDPQLEKEVKVSFLISRQCHLCPKQEPWLNRGPWIILMVYLYCWTVWSVTHTRAQKEGLQSWDCLGFLGGLFY